MPVSSNKRVVPDLSEILREHGEQFAALVNCIQIVKIETIDRTAGTVTAQIQLRRLAADGTSTEYPVLVDCPYIVLQGGGAYLDMPIAPGDFGLAFFNDRDIDTWWTSGGVSDPNTRRKHSFSDAIVLVGLSPSTKVLDSSGQYVRLLGPSGSGSEAFAARKSDAVQSGITDDSTFWTWLAAAAAVLAGMGVAVPAPTSLTGKITGGSSEVQIG